jgi:hypothetical protein
MFQRHLPSPSVTNLCLQLMNKCSLAKIQIDTFVYTNKEDENEMMKTYIRTFVSDMASSLLKLDVSFQILEEYFLNYAFFPKQWQHK